jgi:hypothetical protein
MPYQQEPGIGYKFAGSKEEVLKGIAGLKDFFVRWPKKRLKAEGLPTTNKIINFTSKF